MLINKFDSLFLWYTYMWSELVCRQICVFRCTRFHWKFVRFYMTKRCFMGTEAVVEMVINQGGLAQMEISISHLFLRAWKMVASLSHLSITSAQNYEFCCNNFESHKRWLKSNLKFVLGFSKCLLHVMSQRNLIEHDLRSWHDDFWWQRGADWWRPMERDKYYATI